MGRTFPSTGVSKKEEKYTLDTGNVNSMALDSVGLGDGNRDGAGSQEVLRAPRGRFS